MRGKLWQVWFCLLWAKVVFSASLLGVGTKSTGGGLEIADASFQFGERNNDGLTRLIGSGLNIELDRLAIKTSYGYLTLSPQTISFKRNTATWSTQYFDERMEIRRNNDILIHIIATGKGESYQYRFLGEGHFRDILLDQGESSRTFGLLCRADKSIAAQRRLDPSICRQETSEAHLTLTQQLEMIGRIVSTLTDLHFSEMERVKKDTNRESKQDNIDFMRKDVERQISEVQNNILRSIQEKNRTAFDGILRDQLDTRTRLEAISASVSDRWREFHSQQVGTQVNISVLSSRLDSFASKFTDFDARIGKVSQLVNEQVLKQQTSLTEKMETSFQAMEKNVSALQAHVHQSVDFKIHNITTLFFPSMLNQTTTRMTQFVSDQVASLSSTHQATMQLLNESWQEQHRRHQQLLATGLNTTLTVAKEHSSSELNASIAALQTYTHAFVQEQVTHAVTNVTSVLQANVTLLDERFNSQLHRLQNLTFFALQTTQQAVRDLDLKTQEQLQVAQSQFNASTVDQQIWTAIEHWNTSLLHPLWTQTTQQLYDAQSLEASLWRHALQNASEHVLQASKAYSEDTMSMWSQSLQESVSSNVTLFHDTLHSALYNWNTTWQSTQQAMDAALTATVSLVTENVAGNVSLITGFVRDTDRDLRQEMLSLRVNVSHQLHTFLTDGDTHRQALQQNISHIVDVWQRNASLLQTNITHQLQARETHLHRLIQDDTAHRQMERANFTVAFTQQFQTQAQQLLHWQETWRNQTDVAIHHVHDTLLQVRHQVENTTSRWSEKWLQVHTQAAVLEQRTQDDHALLQTQQTQLQTQQVQLALVTQAQQEVLVPQLAQVTSQWRNWTEIAWPVFRQETLLWRQDTQHAMKAVQDNLKVCQEQNSVRDKEHHTLRDTVASQSTDMDKRLKDQDLRLKQQEDELKKLRTELESSKALVAKLVKDQEAMKLQQERMQDTLLNQVLLMMKTQQPR